MRHSPFPRLFLGLILLVVAGCHRSSSGLEDQLTDRYLTEDDPDEAQRYFWMKRAPLDGQPLDLFERTQKARIKADRMPRFSSRLGRFLSSPDKFGPSSGGRAALAPTAWEPLGPGNIGGRTRALLIDPDNPQVLYAAGVSGGVWKTVDGGASWRALADFLPNIAVSSMAMDPADSRVLYAGTGEGHFREIVRGTGLPLRGAGVFKSVDAGQTWHRLDSTATGDFQWVNRLRVSPRDSRRVYAATRSGVWRSLDAGETWSRVLPTTVLGGCFDLALRPDTSGDRILASCGTFQQATIYLNPNAEGASGWTPVLTEFGMGLTSLAMAPSDPTRVYAISASYVGGPNNRFNGGLHAVFFSDQGGAVGTWTARLRNTSVDKLSALLLTNPLIAYAETCGVGPESYSNLGWYTNTIAVDPVNPEILWAGGVDLFRSDDGGRSWGPVTFWWDSPPSSHADQHALVFDPGYDGQSNQTLYVGSDGGVWRTDNARAAKAGAAGICDSASTAVRWTNLNHNYGVTQFYHGAPFPDGRSYFGGTQDNGTLISSDAAGQEGWNRILGGDGGYVAVDPNNPQILYAEAQQLNFHKSIDGGRNFSPAVEGITEARGGFLFITPFVMDPGDSRRLWTGGRFPWRTDNAAALWVQAGAALAPGGSISAIGVSPVDPRRVLVGLNNGFIHRQDNALGADGSTDWPFARPREGFVSWLAWDPVDADVAYATYAGFGGVHVWKTTDSGANWIGMDGSGATGLPDIPIHSLVVDPDDRDRIYLGTDLGVFVSVDGGLNWAVENTGFANVVTESLSVNKPAVGPAALFAFTHGRGAWRVQLGAGQAGCSPDRWIAHVTPDDAPFTTTILASNFSNQENVLTLVPYDEAGDPLPPAALTVLAGESKSVLSQDLFLGQPVSHFGICGPKSTAVTAGYRITGQSGVTAHALETALVDQEFLAYTGERELVFDGMALVNLGDAPAQVVAVLLDGQGGEVSRVTLHEALPPHGKELAVFDAEFAGAIGVAVRVESSQPATILLLRGTIPPNEPMVLFEIPAIAVSARR